MGEKQRQAGRGQRRSVMHNSTTRSAAALCAVLGCGLLTLNSSLAQEKPQAKPATAGNARSKTAAVEKPTSSSATSTKVADASASKPNFDNVGPQVGDQLPRLSLRNLQGDPQRMSDAWNAGPALLVTSSLTCPKSRSRWPELKALAEKYDGQLNVAIVYVIEAHPIESVCPYKGVVDVTTENERDGILRKQPGTLDNRIELAQEFKRYLRITTPIYVDTLNNQAWKAFGAAPNIAMLVDQNGIVVARQSWFVGADLQALVDRYLTTAKGKSHGLHIERMDNDDEDAAINRFGKDGADILDFRNALRDKDSSKLAQYIKKDPTIVNLKLQIQKGHDQETTVLMEAAHDNNIKAAELLLKNGANIKARTHSFDSALQVAAEDGHLEMCKLLLRYHADPAFPPGGMSPVHEALLNGRLEVARVLLDAGAPADFFANVGIGNAAAVQQQLTADPSWALRADGAGRMPLDYAAANGQLELAKLLLDNGAPVVDEAKVAEKPPLHRAIEHDNLPMVKLLLEGGSSPDTAVGHGGESATSLPALHLAVHRENAEIVALLAQTANLEVRDTYSQTALHDAASSGQAEIARILLRAGADVNAPQLRFDLPCGSGEERTPSHNTPLHYAAALGNPETIQVLVDNGADLEARNAYGVTPLLATFHPPLYTGVNKDTQSKNITALIAAKADINARDKKGNTILDAAHEELNGKKLSDDRRAQLQAVVALLKEHSAQQGESKAKNSAKKKGAKLSK